MTEEQYVNLRKSLDRKLALIDKFGTVDTHMRTILQLAIKQLEKEGQEGLAVDAYMDIISYWKNRCEKIMTQANADIDEIIKLTRDIAKRSSVETDARLAEFIKKGDGAQDVEVVGDTLEERAESLGLILKQQKRESIINDIASQIGRGTFYEDAERIYDMFIDGK